MVYVARGTSPDTNQHEGTNNMMKIRTMIAWGGSDDNETLDTILERILTQVPASRATRVEGAIEAGWPVFDIEFPETDLDAMSALFELTTPEFVETYAIESV